MPIRLAFLFALTTAGAASGALQITTTSLPPATPGKPYSFQLSVTGGVPPYTWQQSGYGISVGPSGLMSGTMGWDPYYNYARPVPPFPFSFPLQAQTYQFPVIVSDAKGAYASTTLSLTVLPPAPTLTSVTTSLPPAYKDFTNGDYKVPLVATGGAGGPYYWMFNSSVPPGEGDFPDFGIGYGSDNGLDVLFTFYVPPVAPVGSYPLVFLVLDSAFANYAVVPLTLNIVQSPPQSLQINTASLPNATSGKSYQTTVSASGGSGTGYVWSVAPEDLPDGFALSAAGVLSSTGSPGAMAQSYDLTIQVKDSAGNTAMRDLTLVVKPPGLQITTTSLPNGTSGQPYSATLSAMGGTEMGYTWSLASGTLFQGFALSPGGVITSSGSPSISGQASFAVKVTDSAGNSATQVLTLVVSAAGTQPDPTPTPTPLPTPEPTPAGPLDPYPITLGDASGQSGSCVCGDPITISTGNLFEKFTDYETAGPNKLTFARYYNSESAPRTYAVSLGQNWRSHYDRYLDLNSPVSITAERQDGQALPFAVNNAGAWATAANYDYKLIQSGPGWVLTDPDDTTETYTLAPNGSEAVLTSIRARNGYTQTLQYNGNTQLVSVTDSFNRTLTFAYQGALLKSVTTPDGTIIDLLYNSGGADITHLDRLIEVEFATAHSFYSYVYGAAGFPYTLTGIVDEDGNRYATWTYDSSGRALTSQHGAGAGLTAITYDDATGARTVTNALGQKTTFQFIVSQGAPELIAMERAATATTAAATQRFSYDGNGFLAGKTDWNGNATKYVNDVHGQPISISEAAGTPQERTTTILYLSDYHLPSQIATPGLTANFYYDATGNLLSKTLTDTATDASPDATMPRTRTWTYTWSNSLLASVKGPRSDISQLTSLNYDASGALTAMTNALGQTTKVTQHLPGGLPQAITDPNGVTNTLTYDARFRVLTSVLATGSGPLTTTYTYDAAGNRLSVTAPDGATLRNTYDAAHRLTGTADALLNSVTYLLDAAGNRLKISLANPAGAVARQHSAAYDALSRAMTEVGGAGQTTSLGYDANGNPVSITDPLNQATTQVFDALNRRIQSIDAAHGVTAFGYDAHDRPVSVTDPTGAMTTYTYDGFGDVIQEQSPARGVTVYTYDQAGNLARKTDARGAVAAYAYDALNRLISISYPADPVENVTYSYDQAGHGSGIGRLTSVADAAGTLSVSYDERGNVLTETRTINGATLATSYAYDPANRVASITYPSGLVAAYARDTAGRVTGVNAKLPGSKSATPLVSNIGYQPFGPANALTYGNGIVESRRFDLDYRVTSLSAGKIQSLGYGYDAANNVLSIADGVSAGNSQSFGYDPLDRLTSATGGYGILRYTYDANGNRLTQDSPDAAPIDGLGSMATFAYNQAGRLASTRSATGPQTTQYTYDAFGQRLVKLGSVTAGTIYQYDTSRHLLEESNLQGSASADYIYLGGRPIAEYSAGKLYFLHNDRLGTPQVATDASQTPVWMGNYDPFGTLNGSASQTSLLGQDLRFPGQEADLETGLYHNGFREYVPGSGRYLESDPLGLLAGSNTYSYVGDNPAGAIDPDGRLLVGSVIGGNVAFWVDFVRQYRKLPPGMDFIDFYDYKQGYTAMVTGIAGGAGGAWISSVLAGDGALILTLQGLANGGLGVTLSDAKAFLLNYWDGGNQSYDQATVEGLWSSLGGFGAGQILESGLSGPLGKLLSDFGGDLLGELLPDAFKSLWSILCP